MIVFYYRHTFLYTIAFTLTRLANWHEKIRQANFKTFNIESRTNKLNYRNILNYFDNRFTNASAETFNEK